jgi:CPA2 family monovalent cation:H+ antiporter-2
MEQSILAGGLTLLAVAIVAVTAFRRLGLPPILGYLTVGLVCGPYGFGWVAMDEHTQFLGEIGIVFLLFSIGLEFSVPLLFSMRRDLLGVGGLQVAGGTLAGFGIALGFGLPWQGAVILGAATALSSTAIVLKQLGEQLELHQRHGRLSVGILLFQDLAAIPFLVVIPILAADQGDLFWPLGAALLKGVVAFALIWFLGRRILPGILHTAARAASTELFTLTALFLALATAWLTSLFGLSLALGAFLSGMLLGETAYRHQVENDVRPFRDLLMGLFFVIVGMKLDYWALTEMWWQTLTLIVGITLGKGILIASLVHGIGLARNVALRVGIVLGHGGEFGIALLALALAQGLLDSASVQPVLAAMIASMLLAPVLVRHNAGITHWLLARQSTPELPSEAAELEHSASELRDHVIIAGFGRLGQNLATFLRKLGIPYLALDLDPDLIHQARMAGEPVYYGDCSRRATLAAARVHSARALVVSFDQPKAVAATVDALRELPSRPAVLVRTRDQRALESLWATGADVVIAEPLEASLALAQHLLRRLDYAESDLAPLLESMRRDSFRELRRVFYGQEAMQGSEGQARLETLILPPNAHAVQRTLTELALGDFGVELVAIRRSGIRGDQPLADTRLMPGDALLLEGPAEGLERAIARLLGG